MSYIIQVKTRVTYHYFWKRRTCHCHFTKMPDCEKAIHKCYACLLSRRHALRLAAIGPAAGQAQENSRYAAYISYSSRIPHLSILKRTVDALFWWLPLPCALRDILSFRRYSGFEPMIRCKYAGERHANTLSRAVYRACYEPLSRPASPISAPPLLLVKIIDSPPTR